MNQNRITEAYAVIDRVMEDYKKPVLMCSFGKDSMVLLHLLRSYNLPVLFHREPFHPWKYSFANRVIEAWNLTVYDYPPSKVSLFKRNGMMELMNEYSIGQETCMLPTGIIHPQDGKPYLCGLKDLVCKPLGTFSYPWDVCFLGHKASDVDPLQGNLRFNIDVKRNPGSAHAAYPMRTWTDDDVWAYIELNHVPYQENRYAKIDGEWQELPDKTFNPDYFHTCTRCIDRDEASDVRCPLNGLQVNNVSSRIQYIEPQFDYITKEQLCHSTQE